MPGDSKGRILTGVVVSKRVAWFLIAFGGWSWIIWPTFLNNIWADHRSWNHGMTAFFGVHLVLTVVSLTLGTMRRRARHPRAARRARGAGGRGPHPRELTPVRQRSSGSARQAEPLRRERTRRRA